MPITARLNGISIWAAFVIGCAAFMTPAHGETGGKSPPPPAPPPSAIPQPAPVPPPPPAPPDVLAANAPGAIGLAEMNPNGTIRLHLRRPTRAAPARTIRPGVPWSPPQENVGYGEIEISRGDSHYGDMLGHLGGLSPGQVKPVPPWRADERWHCALDPDRGPCPLNHLLPGHAAVR
jgi:hypothetical protein